MPLIKSKSKPALSTNIREMISAGHPRDQAVAAAYATARKAGAKWAHKADGGPADAPPPTNTPSDPAVAPIPYIDFPDQSAPPPPPPSAPPPRQAIPRPQRPPTGPPTAPPPKGHGSPRNPADLVKNLKTFYDHYGELRPDQQERLMEMLGQPLDQPSAMKPEIDWDEFMKNHDLPGAMRDRPMYHPPYRGAAQGGVIGHAMRLARQAGGGNPIALPLMGKPGDAAAPAFQGPIHSHVPGRTDKIDLDVAHGSYVVPADVVSSFGEGNSLAGGHLIRFQMGAGADLAGGIKPPQGHGMLPLQPHPKLAHMKPPKGQKHAVGGVTHNNGNVPIVAAGGEVVIPPEHLVHKFGDLDRGHRVWDEIVRQEREAEIKRLKSAPPPKKAYGGAVESASARNWFRPRR